MRLRVTWLALVVVGGTFSRGAAHDLPIGSMMMVADEDFLHVELMMNSAELVFFGELDRDKDGRLAVSEVRDQGDEIARRIIDCFTIEIDGRRLEPDTYGIVPAVDTHHVTVRAHYAVDARDVPLSVTSRLWNITRGAHSTQVTFRKPGGGESARLNARSPQVVFNGSSPAIQPRAESLSTTASPGVKRSTWFLVGVPIGLATLIGCLLLLKSKNV